MTISYRSLFALFLLATIPIMPSAIALSVIFITFIILAFPLKKAKMQIYYEIWPLITLVFIGMIAGIFLLFESGSMYFYFRDIFYFLMPVLSISVGYYLAKRLTNKELMRIIVLGAFISSMINYAEFLFGFDFFTNDLLDNRYKYQLNSGMALIGFSILYFSSISKFFFFKKMTRLALLIFFLILIIVSVSRTNLGALFVIIMLPFLLPRISANSQLFILVTFVLVAIFAGAFLPVAIADSVPTNFIEKVLSSGSEVVVREYEGAININQYWRSYEAFLGLQVYLDAGYFGLLFGQGFGSYASASDFFETKFQYIPIFHNGFITILLKTGIIGILIFFIFLMRVVRLPENQMDIPVKFYVLLSTGMMWVLVINTYVIHGLYTSRINILLLFVLGYIFQKKQPMEYKRYNANT